MIISDNKSRSSTRLSKAPFSERAHFQKTEATLETAETNRNESQSPTPKRLRQVSKPKGNSFDDFKVMESQSNSKFNKFNTEIPRRNSKRIQVASENKIAARTSPLFIESPRPKRHVLRSNSTISKKQPGKFYCDESSGSAAEECSLSEPEEVSSKIPSGINTKNVPKKTNSNSISSPRKNLKKSNSTCMASGFSTPKSKQQTNLKSLQTPAPVRKKIKKGICI